MSPRTRIAALAVAAAALVAGCSNYTTSSDVARVDDATLSIEELRDLMPAFTGAPVGETVDGVNGINFVGNGDASRAAIQFWLTGEIAGSSLDRAGTEVPASLIDQTRTQLSGLIPGFAELSESSQTMLVEVEATIAFFSELPMPNETFEAAVDDVDLYVSPRFGQFRLPGGVVPLVTPDVAVPEL